MITISFDRIWNYTKLCFEIEYGIVSNVDMKYKLKISTFMYVDLSLGFANTICSHCNFSVYFMNTDSVLP